MKTQILGFLDGYLYKQAGPGTAAAIGTAQAGLEAGGEVAGTLLPYVLLLPALIGAGAGTAHSRMTSPSPTDEETAQKALETAEYEEFAAELERRRIAAEHDEQRLAKRKENSGARTLRI